MILWESIMMWSAVGWAGLMVCGAGCGLWWRHAIRYHVQRCNQCHLCKDGTYDFGYDEEGWLVAATLLWPISTILFTLKCIFYMPLKVVVVNVAKSPEQRVIEREVKDAEFKVEIAEVVETILLDPTVHGSHCACSSCIDEWNNKLLTDGSTDEVLTRNPPPP